MHEYAVVKCKPSHLKDSRGFQQMNKCSLLPFAEQKKNFPYFCGFVPQSCKHRRLILLEKGLNHSGVSRMSAHAPKVILNGITSGSSVSGSTSSEYRIIIKALSSET